jgi:uncharacterized protein (TIGR00730 family)
MKPRKSRAAASTGKPHVDQAVNALLETASIEQDTELYREMIGTIVKMAGDKPRLADVLQFTKVIKEMRYANKVFAPYHGTKKISIFGSARTSPKAGAYKAAQEFGKMMMESGYMVITGGGDGIMAAAQAGAGRERSFALNIELPFEQEANKTIKGDPKLITFKYFFTRKLNFVKHSNAIALFPGGFGTMDECFESFTLLQTGKAPIVPVVLVDEPKGNFWKTFEHYLREHLLGDGLISEDDFSLIKVTTDLAEARKEILDFYYNFHSYRYVGTACVLRMQREVPGGSIRRLREDFSDVLTQKDGLDICGPLPAEINEPELAHLPRLLVHFNRRNYGRFRELINRINLF